MITILLVALGGAIGSILRYISSTAILHLIKVNNYSLAKFPWNTFFVNVVGSFLAGICYYFIIKNFDNFNQNQSNRDFLKNFLLVGMLGGFTTFSAFSLDFFRLMTSGQQMQALLYATISVLVSLLAVFFGFYSTKLFFS